MPLVASLNFDIWWVYKSKDFRPTYVKTMNCYLEFFETSIQAHFIALLVALYALHETRGDTFNIPRLVRILKKENAISGNALTNVTQLLAEIKPLSIKVGILRNKAFGHRSDSLTIAQTFKQARVMPNELKRLVELTKNLLNAVTGDLDGSVHLFNLGAGQATIRVLKDLKTLHEP